MKLDTDIIIFRISLIISVIIIYSMCMYQYGLKEGKKECREVVEVVVQYDTIYCYNQHQQTKPSKSQEIKQKKIKAQKQTKKLLFNVSRNGKDFIRKIEGGCLLVAYPDSKGYSIGYGHHASDVYEGQVITKAEAESYFATDIKRTETSVNRLLGVIPYKFSQSFVDGFSSLVYNCGESGVRNSDFYKSLKEECRYHTNDSLIIKKDLLFTISKVKTMNTKGGILINRRLKEYNLMIQEI